MKAYFAQHDTPAKRSPVGELMPRILQKNPGMTFEEARAEANRLLQVAAGWKHFQMPPVLSPEEHARRKAVFVQRMRSRNQPKDKNAS